MKPKKFLAAFMALTIVGGASAVYARPYSDYSVTASAEDLTYGDLTYSIRSDYYDPTIQWINITDCDESVVSVDIPAEIDGIPVTTISTEAFAKCTELVEVNIPDSVDYIGVNAFRQCASLTSITIPESVTYISNYAFSETGLTSITIPKNVTEISEKTFYNCVDLESVTLPDGITEIGGGAFNSCEKLTDINLPEGLISIEHGAFYQCRALSELKLPESLKSIGDSIFSRCTSLTHLNLPEGLIYIGEYAFIDSSITEIELPGKLTQIDRNTFARCYELTELTVPANILYIDKEAFMHCSSLESITILNPDCEIYDSPDTISSSNYYSSFQGTIYGYDNSTAQAYAEKYDIAFESLGEAPPAEDLPEGSDDDYVVLTDGYLTYYKYSDHISIEKFDEYEYRKTEKTEFTIPDKIKGLPVTEIGDSAFYYSYTLESITIPDTVTSIGKSAFERCYDLTYINLPEGLTSIGKNAFSDCLKLISITLPDGITSIEDSTFDSCIALESVTLPKNLKTIGNDAFVQCERLTELVIPDGVTTIGSNAFFISGLTDITVPDSVIKVGSGAFRETPWLKAKRKEDPLVIAGRVVVNGEYCSGDVTIPEGIVSISDGAFYFSGIKSVHLPESLTYMGNSTFSATPLASINFPSGVTEIGESLFEHTQFTEITIPENITSIGEGAFTYCTELESITILNPDCDIFDEEFTIANSVNYLSETATFNGTIYGYAGSTAQAYAEKYGYNFAVIGDAPPVENKPYYGDANCDNDVTMADAVLIMQSIANPDKYGLGGSAEGAITEKGSINADCYDPGSGITVNDALSIQKYLLQLITSLPEEK